MLVQISSGNSESQGRTRTGSDRFSRGVWRHSFTAVCIFISPSSRLGWKSKDSLMKFHAQDRIAIPQCLYAMRQCAFADNPQCGFARGATFRQDQEKI